MTIADAQVRPSAPQPSAPQLPLVIENASWELYELMLRDTDGQNIRITYDQGRLTVMSPLPIHERWKMLIGGLIQFMAVERNIRIASLGSTTWKRRDLAKGLEPDQCFYVQHEPQLRGRTDIDLNRDPPPDLAIEIDVTHAATDRAAIYASLGVPELWRYDGKALRAEQLLVSGNQRRYEPIETSLAFPFLKPRELERFIAMLPHADETSILRAWRAWIADLP